MTDDEGMGINARTYDNGGHETARTLAESSEGGFFLVGSTMEIGDYQADIWLVRTDTLGMEAWNLQIEEAGNDAGWDAVEPDTKGYIVLGNTMSSGNGSYDAVLYRIDPLGNIMWRVNAGDNLWNTSSGLSMNSEGNLFFAGRTQSPEGDIFKSWLVHASPDDLMNW